MAQGLKRLTIIITTSKNHSCLVVCDLLQKKCGKRHLDNAFFVIHCYETCPVADGMLFRVNTDVI